MSAEFSFTVNGQGRTTRTDGARPLLDVLREDFGLTGTKFGCGEGDCRACTVLLEGKPVRSCQVAVSAAAGKKIETIEGLSRDGKLHPVQEAFIREEAMQCGYCVPGMVMGTVALLRENPRPNRGQIVKAMNGHLCRCCGYTNLIKAIETAIANGGAQ